MIIAQLCWRYKLKHVAFISDIHSNLPALESTIKDIRSRGIKDIYCLGDVVGYHTFPNEVTELLQKENITTIKGNHDEMITNKEFDRKKESDFVLYWNFDQLSTENLLFLQKLPISIRFSIENVSINIVHGSPNSISEYIREGSAEIEKYLSEMNTDILICAHTHVPYIFKDHGKYIMNCGSVGKPKFGKPESSYLLLKIDNNNILSEIITVNYPIYTIVDSLKVNNFPKKLIRALETGLP